MTTTQDPLIGNTIGNCRLETRLAAGGMGVVYRAQSRRLDREVAMKILAPSLATDPEYVERFFREARAAASIDHPNVVKVFESGTDQDRYFMIMEYVRGRTLADLIGEKGRLNLEMATRLTRDVAKGLEAAHKAGLIHRDVKPSNILLTHDLVPKITDFGLVRTGSRPSGITMEGVFMGTPEYVSPEQAEGRKIDARSDLYALGVTYYQMLSGSYPFFGKTAMDMALARIREEPRPIENALPGIDARAAAVVKKLLKKSANERYANATDLIRDLEAILTGRTPAAAPQTRKGTSRLSVLSLDSKRRVRLVFFSLLFLITLAAFAGLGLTVAGGWRAIASAFQGFGRDLGPREAFLLIGAVAFVGSLFIFRRELVACGRGWSVLLLLIGALASVFVGMAGLEATYRGDVADLSAAGRELGWVFRQPVHALAGALAIAVLSIGLAWTKPPGEFRYILFRVLLWGSVALLYVFATGKSLHLPIRHLRDSMHILLPMGTGALVVVMFGIELSVAYRWTGGARAFGVFLLMLGMAAVVAFGAVGLHDLETRVDWAKILAAPFAGLRHGFRAAAGPLGVAAILLAGAWVLYLGGLAKNARKRP